MLSLQVQEGFVGTQSIASAPQNPMIGYLNRATASQKIFTSASVL
jgi:hypothetical protein